MKIKTIFFGSPLIAANLLSLLLENQHLEISLVVTQPDRPMGKRLQPTPTPVKQAAHTHGMKVYDKEIHDEATRKDLEKTIQESDPVLGILYAYGALIPESIINLFPQGIWNVHPSLLPLYRGPSPTAYPLLLGDSKTGVSIMKLVKKLDAGPLVAQTEKTIDISDTRSSLEDILTVYGADLINNKVKDMINGIAVSVKIQDEAKSTYTRLLKKEDGYIPLSLLLKGMHGEEILTDEIPSIIHDYMIKYDIFPPYTAAEIIRNMIRAFSPWPGVWTMVDTNQGKKRLQIQKAKIENNFLIITEVKLEGKKPVDFKTFNKAYSLTDEK